MGEDAEHYMDQQEEEERFGQACEYAELNSNNKSVLCWIDGYPEEIWSWAPFCRMLGVFSVLHNTREIGRDCFLASRIPVEDDEEDWDDEYSSPAEAVDLCNSRVIDELEFCLATTEAEATHEVIVLTPHDAVRLKREAARQKSSAKTLKEEMLAEMLEEMSSFIEAEPQQNQYVFAREL